MNTNEGLKRTAKIIRWLGFIIGGIIIFISLFEAINGGGDRFQTEAVFIGLVVAVAAYLIGAAVAWIIEGFMHQQ